VGASDVRGAASYSSSAPPAALKPGTSAFAAAGAVPLEADVAAAQDQQHKGGPASPHRPPLHPVKHTGRGVYAPRSAADVWLQSDAASSHGMVWSGSEAAYRAQGS
jgi:hypothetical protein